MVSHLHSYSHYNCDSELLVVYFVGRRLSGVTRTGLVTVGKPRHESNPDSPVRSRSPRRRSCPDRPI